MFVKTIVDDLFNGERSYAKGSVIEVDNNRGKYLVDEKQAVPDAGPASEPKAEKAATPPAK